jgi:DNA-binding response OmpR family regulator
MAEAESTSYLKGLRVLAVDDEVDVLDTIEDILDESQVDRALDYDTALKKLQDTPYDLAILDIMGVSGLALLTEAVDKGIPTVMLTAHAMNPETLRTSISQGALSYLPKEELSNLDDFLNALLGASRQGRSTWALLFERLGRFFEKSFGPQWARNDPEFWEAYGYIIHP